MDRKTGEWYCNFAAGSFHTKKLCSRLYSIEIEFNFLKTKNRFWSHPLGNLGLCTPSIARWKTRGGLPIRVLFTLFTQTRFCSHVVHGESQNLLTRPPLSSVLFVNLSFSNETDCSLPGTSGPWRPTVNGESGWT